MHPNSTAPAAIMEMDATFKPAKLHFTDWCGWYKVLLTRAGQLYLRMDVHWVHLSKPVPVEAHGGAYAYVVLVHVSMFMGLTTSAKNTTLTCPVKQRVHSSTRQHMK